MRKYFNSSLFRKNVFTLIFILLGLIPLIWFKNGLLIAGGDNTPSYLGFEKKFNLPTTWEDYVNFGFYTKGLHHLIYSNLTNVFDFIPDSIFQMLLFFFFFFFRLFIYYKLLSLLFNKKENKILLFPAILLFALNPYFLIDSISLNVSLVPIQMSLIFIFVYKFFYQNKIDFKDLILISITNSFLFSNPATLFATYIPGGLYFIFNLFFQRKNLGIFLRRVFGVVLIFMGLNLWYLIPVVKSFLEISNVASIVNTFRAVASGYLYDHFRLIGQWAWYSRFYLYPYFPFAQNYYQFPLIFSTFGVTLLGLSLLLFLPHNKVFKKRERKTFYFFGFLFLFGLFLAKGGKPPLGLIYMAIYNAFPIFWMFREPWAKFTPLVTFSLPVLLYGSLLYLRQKIKNSRLQKVLYGILIMVIIVNVYPIFTGEVIWDNWNGSMRSFRVRIPQYWQDIKRYIVNNNLGKYRLLTFPASGYGMAYNWRHGLSSADDVAVYLLPNPIIRYSSFPLNNSDLLVNQLFDKLSNKNFNLKNYLSLLNTRYILQENDVDWRYSSNALSPSESNRVLADNDFRLIESFGLFSKEYLFQIPNKEPDERLHKELYKELLNKPALTLYEISDDYFLPHFYIPQNIIYSNGKLEDLPEIVGLPDYQIRSGIYLGKINGLMDSQINELKERADEIIVKGERKDIGYWISDISEKESLKSGVPVVYVRRKPGSWQWKLARIKEQFEEWKVRKEPEKLIDKKLYFAGKRIAEVEKFNNINELTNLILTNYKEKMEEAIEEVRRYRNLELKNFGDWEGQVIKLRVYLEKHREKINELFINELTNSKLKAWEGVFEELESKVAELEPKPDFEKLVYQFEIPKKGDYEIFIKNINELTNYLLTDSGENTKSADEWAKTGERNFGEGKQELVLPFSGMSKNLVDKNLEIRNYLPNSMYQLSLDYQTSESGKILVKENEDKEIAKEKIFPTEGKFKHLEMFFQSSAEATSAAILFSKTENNEEKKLTLNYKNLQVKQIYQPEVILKSIKNIDEINELTNYKKTPKITFVKINPTKYRVKVEGAKNPYTLVFSESFHKGWKLYINELTDSRINELKNYGEIVASYFDGEIKEGTHRMTFLERATFETWGKKPIAEDRHYLVNGYANSWYITPDDVGGAENYELIVEFWPQRLFYVGLFISGLTLLFCIGYLIYDKIKRVKN